MSRDHFLPMAAAEGIVSCCALRSRSQQRASPPAQSEAAQRRTGTHDRAAVRTIKVTPARNANLALLAAPPALGASGCQETSRVPRTSSECKRYRT